MVMKKSSQETTKQEDSQRDETEKPPKRSSQELQQITAAKIEDALIPCRKIESNNSREKRKRKQRDTMVQS